MKMSVKTVGKEKVGVLDIPGFYVGLTDDVKGAAPEAGETERQQHCYRPAQQWRRSADRSRFTLRSVYPVWPGFQVRDNNGKVREDSDTDGVVYYKGPLVVLVDRSVLRPLKSSLPPCGITVAA